MSMLLPLTLAAAASGPVATGRPWPIVDDFPDKALSGKTRGAALVRILVDPRGKPVSCAVEDEIGDGRFGKDACRTAMRRGKFQPARDGQGTAIHGVVRRIANYWLPDGAGNNGYPKVRQPDVTLRMSAATDQPVLPAMVRAAIVVRADGTLESCTPEGNETRPDAAEQACGQIVKGYRPDVATGPGDIPLRYAQTLDIAFLAPPR